MTPTKCKWCEQPAMRRQGHIWLCAMHYRFQQMRVHATRRGKSTPSYEELESLTRQLGKELTCPVCRRPMNWLGTDGQDTVVSLRHDRSGNHRLLCRSCSTRATFMSGDSFYELPPGMKMCHSCGEIKPLSDFLVDRSRSRSRGAYCKVCSHRRVTGWVKERRQASMENRLREIVRRRRAYCKTERAGRPARDFAVTAEDVFQLYREQQGRCYYSGEPLAFDELDRDRLVSLDRQRNAHGYIPGNVVLCCWRVNNMKRDLDDVAFVSWCRRIAGDRDAQIMTHHHAPRSGHRRWRSLESALRVKLDNARQRVRRSNGTTTLNVDQLLEAFKRQGGCCYYTGVSLTYDQGGDTDVSIDRMDNTKGYTVDNVALCCWRVNNMKGDLNASQFIDWAAKISSRRDASANNASEATSEPAPGAAFSGPLG